MLMQTALQAIGDITMSGIPHVRTQIKRMERPAGTFKSKSGGGNMNSDGSLKPRLKDQYPRLNKAHSGDRYTPTASRR